MAIELKTLTLKSQPSKNDFLILHDIESDGLKKITPKSLFYLNILKITTVNDANYTANSTDELIVFIGMTAHRTLNLPDATENIGKQYIIKDRDGLASTYNIIIDPYESQLIDGSTTYTMNTAYSRIRLYCDGNRWLTI